MTSNWYVARSGQKIGPFSVQQIQQLATLGMVNADDHLLEEGAVQWVTALSLPWLSFARVSRMYYVNAHGKAQGPFTIEQVRVALLAGNVAPETLARAENQRQWASLGTLSEFRDSLPTTVKEPEGPTQGGGETMTPEEAELYLASKKGDAIARLVGKLQEIRKNYASNPDLQDIIGKNIRDLLDLRAKGNIVHE